MNWKNTTLKKKLVKEEIEALKQEAGATIVVGSPGLIVAFTQLGLIDQYHLGLHPTVVGNGLPLFKNISERVDLKLLNTKTFGCGAVMLYYETVKK